MMWALKPAPSKAGAMMIPMAQMKKLAVVTQTGTEPRLPALGSGSYQASLMWEAPAQPSLSRQSLPTIPGAPWAQGALQN